MTQSKKEEVLYKGHEGIKYADSGTTEKPTACKAVGREREVVNESFMEDQISYQLLKFSFLGNLLGNVSCDSLRWLMTTQMGWNRRTT